MKRAAAGLAASALAIGGVLTGCGSAAEEAAEQAIENSIGGDIEIDEDGLRYTDEEGNEYAVGDASEVPENWPADVPVPTGTIVSSTTAGGNPTIIVTVSAAAPDAFAAIDGEFTSQGWTQDQTTDLGGIYGGVYTKDARTASLTVLDDTEGASTVTVTHTEDNA